MDIKQTEEEKFLEECPAWSRKQGIRNIKQWHIAVKLMPFDKGMRIDKLCEMEADKEITAEERKSIEACLTFWDNERTYEK